MIYLKVYIITLILALLQTFQAKLSAQYSGNQNQYAIKTNQIFTGSGHSSVLSVSFSLRNNGHGIQIGSLLSYNANYLSGINIRYQYYIANKNGLEAYVFFQSLYRYESPLNDQLNTLMLKEGAKAQQLQFNTYENYAGTGLQVNVLKNVILNGSIGIGYYCRTLQSNTDPRREDSDRYSKDHDISLSLSAGLTFKL